MGYGFDDSQLCLVLFLPRSGSTMTVDCLGLHSKIFAPPELNILNPLFHTGYVFNYVEREPGMLVDRSGTVNHSICQMVAHLPNRESDYIAALRAYADQLYGGLLASSNKSMFVDKSTIWTSRTLAVVEQMYPGARYLVIVRRPEMSALSHWRTAMMFGAETQEALDLAVDTAVDGMSTFAAFARARPESVLVVNFETLVDSTEAELTRIVHHLGYAYEAAMLDRTQYNAQYWLGLGDPKSLYRRARPQAPQTDGVRKLPLRMLRYEITLLSRLAARLDSRALEFFGYDKSSIYEQVYRRERLEGYELENPDA